jgi:hypothetical protein
MLDNLDYVELALCIDPQYQHRGHGRALLAHALDRIDQLGRHQVTVGINEPAEGPPNRAMRFAAAAGASRSLGELRRSLDLTALDTDRLATLRDEAEKASVGYELVSWTNPCPAELVDDFAALYARMSTDAPLGDLDIEPENWDPTGSANARPPSRTRAAGRSCRLRGSARTARWWRSPTWPSPGTTR